VERAQPFVVHPRLAERDKLAYHIYDVHGVHDFIYCRSVYHNYGKGTKKTEKKIHIPKIFSIFALK
jgi:hypothetical protein